MNVAFWDNSLSERGTTIALFDYAYFNQTILKNNSYVFYNKNGSLTKQPIVDKFRKHFTVHGVDSFEEVDEYLRQYNISHIYIIKKGEQDCLLSKVASNCIHCVFTCKEPHGDVYATVSRWVDGNNGQYPVVPHMVSLPSFANHDEDMRQELNISKDAVVFGGYGGWHSFNISFVQKTVYQVAKSNPSIYFVFANFDKFCLELPNIIHLPTLYDSFQKVKFINTCDAMIWGRKIGESFGLAIAEFSSFNKPVIATKKVRDQAHVNFLEDKGIWYKNRFDLKKILLTFDRDDVRSKDWNAYRDYTPEKVMKIFKEIFLNNDSNPN